MNYPQPRARQAIPSDARMAGGATEDRLSSGARGMLAQLNDNPAGGGALTLDRLAGIVISRDEAVAALLGTSWRSTSGRLGIDPREVVPELSDDHILMQAARLQLAAMAALPGVARDDQEQAQLAASYSALLTDEASPALAEKLERAYTQHQEAVKAAERRGLEPPTFERPERHAPGERFTRPIVVNLQHIKRGPADPRGYLEDEEQALLGISERRTTLLAERRDLERLIAAADARIAATMLEAADLVEAMFLAGERRHEQVDLGPAYGAFSKLWALTTEDFAMLTWERAVEYWKHQIEDA